MRCIGHKNNQQILLMCKLDHVTEETEESESSKLYQPTFSLASMILVRVRQSPWKPLQPMTVVSVL